MTPDLHGKTYNDRQSMGVQGMGQGSSGNPPSHNFTSIHSSAKTNKQLMGLTIGAHSSMGNSSHLQGIGASTTNNAAGQALYSGGNNDSEVRAAIQAAEFDNNGEDLIMMNIPREGNADQLNKSTKLTLSSKKQYENHLQNISLNQHLNQSQNSHNQYMLQMPASSSAQGHQT